MSLLALISDLASFGAAGLMGAMWLWERKLSRLREYQLTQSHERIIRDEQRLGKLIQVVEQNTTANTRVSEGQREVCETLKQLSKEIHRAGNR